MLVRSIKWLVLLGTMALAGVGWLAWDVLAFVERPLRTLPAVHYTIQPGTSVRSLAVDLVKRGYFSNARYFEWYSRATQQAQKIKAGEYRLKSGVSPKQLLAQFVRGAVVQYSLTLVEGWNVKQMIQAVRQDPNLRHTLVDFTAPAIITALGIADTHPEGLFFPDTYHFPKGEADVKFLRRAYDRMQTVLRAQWKHRDTGLPYKNAYEALIMASIIEKETAASSERDAIAGVFIRRLRIKMRLQTDPTVIYGLGDAYDGNIRRRDLKNPHPYNTYMHHGLPPTPIALPGLKSIQAALHPKAGDALYFVARGDGSHYFSVTLAEHNAAVRKYQLHGRKRH